MTAAHFSASSGNSDRRRRLMATDFDAASDDPYEFDVPVRHDDGRASEAFPMLSRDRLIRRVISPRLWKHVTAAVLLTLSPIVYAMLTWHFRDDPQQVDGKLLLSRLNGLRGVSGLKLFAAGQLCLLIAWVRSASPVDFKGRFRWWRWLGLVLFGISVVSLTDSSEWLTNVVALGLKPVFGQLESARPALLLVPVIAAVALVLRYVIPDMGRCRVSQALIIIAAVLVAVRSLVGVRLHSADASFQLGTLELLISGLVLSAVQFHARFVIHVNPNPPVVADQKLHASRTQAKASKTSKMKVSELADAVIVAEQKAEPESVVMDPVANSPSTSSDGSDDQALQDPIAVSVRDETPEEIVSVPANISSDEASTVTVPSKPMKNKSGKKQKLRKAG